MSYKALYRKYRSQTFDELIGQEAIVQTLKNALSENKISHAYLFSGPRGTGKTSVARLFAKALNCEEKLGHQCNECKNCISITEGSNPDVIEIDAASNSGVDEIRNLIESVKYAPINGRYKVYIIDEVHMMTNSAFNALLKTLEEPPSYVVFILCTTDPYKLLPTILSRCQRFEFSKLSNIDLNTLIVRTLQKENFDYEEEAINLLVELANGGGRDALSLLDQLISYCDNKITTKDIEDVFGLISNVEKIKFLENISRKNTSAIIEAIDSFSRRNVNINRFNSSLLTILKDTLLYLKSSTTNTSIFTAEQLQQVATLFSETDLFDVIETLLECQNKIKFSSDPLFVFEVYILKLTSKISTSSTYKEEIKVVETPKKPVENKVIEKTENIQKVDISTEKPAEPQLNDRNLTTKEIENIIFTTTLATEGESFDVSEDSIVKIMVSGIKSVRKEYSDLWEDKLKLFINDSRYGPMAQIFSDGRPSIVTDNIIVIQYNHDISAQKTNIKDNQVYFAELIEKMFNKKYFVYGLNRKDLNSALTHFYSLQQVGLLPKPDEIEKIEIN